jgi:hypothetical protein
MEGHRHAPALLLMLMMVALSGASCPQTIRQATGPPPALPPNPSLAQVIDVVNANNGQIQNVFTNEATLTGPGMPSLRASVAVDRPKRFRLRAETGLTGPEVDLGSNEELFWVWIRRNEPKAIYFCRHDQFAGSAAQRTMPIEPHWLIEALGLTTFDPANQHEGPYPRPGGQLEVRTTRQTPSGPARKITILNARQGWILAQHVYDATGTLTASAVASRHRRDPLTGLVMPRTIDIQCPAAQFSMRVDLGNVQINRQMPGAEQLWAMPQYEGYPTVNLGQPNPGPAASTVSSAARGGTGSNFGLGGRAAQASRPRVQNRLMR